MLNKSDLQIQPMLGANQVYYFCTKMFPWRWPKYGLYFPDNSVGGSLPCEVCYITSTKLEIQVCQDYMNRLIQYSSCNLIAVKLTIFR